MKVFTINALFIFLVLNNNSFSQSSIVASNNASANNNALDIYHNFIGSEADIYNGRLYTSYLNTIAEGIPFLDETKSNPGSITYNNIFYDNIPMLYDILKNKLLIVHNSFMVELTNERVSSFSLLGHNFKNFSKEELSSSMKPGFYEIVHSGKNNVLLKTYNKTLEEDISSGVMKRKIHDKHLYYIYKDENYLRVSRKKDVLNAYRDHRKEINQFIRRKGLRFTRAGLNNSGLASIALHYDELKENEKP